MEFEELQRRFVNEKEAAEIPNECKAFVTKLGNDIDTLMNDNSKESLEKIKRELEAEGENDSLEACDGFIEIKRKLLDLVSGMTANPNLKSRHRKARKSRKSRKALKASKTRKADKTRKMRK